MTSFYKHHTVHQSEFITNISSPNFLSSILSVFPSSERNDANIQNTAITSEFKTGGIFFYHQESMEDKSTSTRSLNTMVMLL